MDLMQIMVAALAASTGVMSFYVHRLVGHINNITDAHNHLVDVVAMLVIELDESSNFDYGEENT